jgi:EAL domain-containing protein (putative c-di-GMP-specific phosphodiesterase class I)
MIGVEALIRWNHPEKGFIPPIEFIPFAEKTGYIVTIDEWVIETACKQKKLWEEQGYHNIKMAVNLSGQMVSETNSLLKIQTILERCNMSYCDIELEVTETAVIKEIENATIVLEGLKQLGISIALDDFGTGYSSLTYLQRLPFNILKIDREFIRNVIHEDEEAFIFKSIVELAHNLGLKVVAEGVETEEQKAFLIKNHCDIGQGYLFSRPVSPTEIEKSLSASTNTVWQK